MPPEIDEKGQALRSTLVAIREELGDVTFDQMLDALPPGELRDAAREGRLLAASWYPIRFRRELYVALAQVAPRERNLPRRISARATTADMRGIYAFIVRMASPATVARYAPRVVATYFRGPTVVAEQVAPAHVRLRFSGFYGFDASLWEDMISGCETILRIAGVPDVESEIEEGGRLRPDARVSLR